MKWVFGYSVKVKGVVQPIVGAMVMEGTDHDFAKKDVEDVLRKNIHDISRISIDNGKEIERDKA